MVIVTVCKEKKNRKEQTLYGTQYETRTQWLLKKHTEHATPCVLSLGSTRAYSDRLERMRFCQLRSNSDNLLLLLLARIINRQDVVFLSAQSITIPLSVWPASISPAH